MSKKAFRIDYPNGHLEVNIGEFFGSGTQKQFNKWLTLARQHCTDAQKEELIAGMEHERKQRKYVLDSIEALENNRVELLNKFFIFNHNLKRGPGTPERELEKQRENLKKRMAILQNERWS